MTVHLVPLAVGIEDAEHLARVQKERLKKSARGGKKPTLRHITRHRPKRADEIVEGGSIYWVIGGAIAARQRILGFEKAAKVDGTPAHAILLDPRLVRTEAKPFRAFQGWRYLPADKVPRDRGEVNTSTETLPASLRNELKELGLI